MRSQPWTPPLGGDGEVNAWKTGRSVLRRHRVTAVGVDGELEVPATSSHAPDQEIGTPVTDFKAQPP
jgi:hypothetical protein